MAINSSSDVTYLSNGTTSQLAYDVGQVPPTIFQFVASVPLPMGQTARRFPVNTATFNAAATGGESAAAMTPSDAITVADNAITPASFRAAAGISSEGQVAALPENDPMGIARKKVTAAMQRYLAYGSSTALVKTGFSDFTATVGSTAALTLATLRSGILTVRTNIGDMSAVLVAWLDGAMLGQLKDDIYASGSPVWGSGAMDQRVSDILLSTGFEEGKNGFVGVIDGCIVMVDPDPAALEQTTSRIGLVFVPFLPGLNGVPVSSDIPVPITENLPPAFGVVFRENPTAAVAKEGVDFEEVETADGVVHLIRRAYAGINQGIIDGWEMANWGMIHDNSGCQLLGAI